MVSPGLGAGSRGWWWGRGEGGVGGGLVVGGKPKHHCLTFLKDVEGKRFIPCGLRFCFSASVIAPSPPLHASSSSSSSSLHLSTLPARVGLTPSVSRQLAD